MRYKQSLLDKCRDHASSGPFTRIDESGNTAPLEITRKERFSENSEAALWRQLAPKRPPWRARYGRIGDRKVTCKINELELFSSAEWPDEWPEHQH